GEGARPDREVAPAEEFRLSSSRRGRTLTCPSVLSFPEAPENVRRCSGSVPEPTRGGERVNKRSAVAVAAGLTGALVSGVAGYSVRVGSSAASPEAAAPLPPIVKHKTKTITIHR